MNFNIHKRFTEQANTAILDRLNYMENFKHKSRHQNTSIDGFMTQRQASTQLNPNAPKSTHARHPQPGQRPDLIVPKVGTFKGVDGFSPAVQPEMLHPAARHKPTEFSLNFENKIRESQRPKFDQPEPKRSKWRLFGRKKSAHTLSTPKKRRFKLKLAAGFGIFLLLIGSGIGLRAFLTGRGIFKGGGNSAILNNQNVDPTQLKGEGDGRVNIMVLGKGGAEQADGPDLTDTIIVASIDPISKEAALLSIPRDFWVKSPSGYQSKINEVYANAKYAALDNYSYEERDSNEAKKTAEKAGIDALESTLSGAMGVPIHYYAMIDFAGFKKAIDTVGGLSINVTEDMAVRESMWINGANYTLNVKAGQQNFDGMKALAFSRSRYTSTRGDFDRAERQRAVILALKDKILSTGTLANPLKINQLISDFGDQVSTDFSVNEILRVYDLAKEIPADKVVSVGLDELVESDQINSLSVQIPKAGLFNFEDIQIYVRNVMRDAFLKKENAQITVLNGTESIGMATKTSKELKSFGYNILNVDDAPTKNYTNTILVDLRNGTNKYTQNYLEKRLNVKAVTSLPDQTIVPGQADFVIILGSDEASRIQN